MLFVQKDGSQGPLLVLLHWLGGSAQTWQVVSQRLAARGVTCAAIDLPGFGKSADVAGDDVASIAEQVAATICSLRKDLPEPAGPWVLGGHSMGGKIAAILARRALQGEAGLENLRGLALVSASPPSPEPMTDAKRADLLKQLGESTGDLVKDRQRAAAFVDDNTGTLPLPPAVREEAVDQVLGMRRTAFRAWLKDGSREDWADRVGVLPLPAIVVAGSKDRSLGPDTQRAHTLPHIARPRLVELANACHLAPLERPGELTEHLTQFFVSLDLRLKTPASRPDAATAALMHSQRTSPATLSVMQHRLAGAQNWNHTPRLFSADPFLTLRALAEVVIPNAGFDLAACLDAQLAESSGDGWRFAALPTDQEAWKQGLASLDLAADRLHGVPFVSLFADQQRHLLHAAAAGTLGPGLLGRLHIGATAYTADRMKLWFEEVRAECTRIYMGDPRTADRIGYTGFADDLGFTQIQLGQQEDFER